jgi:hypothetical protein
LRPETFQPSHFDLLVVWAKIEVDPVLDGLFDTRGHQRQPASRSVDSGEEMSARGARPNVFEIERLTPECSHHVKVGTVDQHAVDDESHPVIFAVAAALLTLVRPKGCRAGIVDTTPWLSPPSNGGPSRHGRDRSRCNDSLTRSVIAKCSPFPRTQDANFAGSRAV